MKPFDASFIHYCIEVSDLNYGDIAVFMESSLAFEVLPDINYSDFPNFENLYRVLKKVPAFNKVPQPFLEFTEKIRKQEIWASWRIHQLLRA